MGDEDGTLEGRSLPDIFRDVLERLDRFATLPPGAPRLRSLGPGSLTPDVVHVGQREPATDVIEGVDMIYLTVELPGVSRRDIDLRATETVLTVSANSPSRKYFREIPLPASVRVDTINATYKNGVLDVALERKDRPWRIPVK
jgi:HSP20 family protein